MILGFKTHIDGKPTGFVEKIRSGKKKHTLREDHKERWRAGMRIEFATGVRTPNYQQFLEGRCISVQRVFLHIRGAKLNVSVNGRDLSPGELLQFAQNDGFDSMHDFEKWFWPLVREKEKKGFSGLSLRLIHWTYLQYQ